MYEAVKRYETYVARNKRLDGKGTSTSTGQQKTTSQSSGTSLDFTRQQHLLPPLVDLVMILITLKVPRLMRTDSQEVEPPPKEDDGLYIPSYLEEAIPDDPVLQVKVAHALQVQEMNSRRCFTCNRPGHLAWDHQEWEEKNRIRPLQSKGPTLNKAASEKAKQKPSQPGRPGPPTE